MSVRSAFTVESEVREQFREAIAAAGLRPPERIVADGKLYRFASSDKRGDDAGYYVFHLDGHPRGAFGCWRSGVKSMWSPKRASPLTDEQQADLRKILDEAKARRDAEQHEKHKRAAMTAESLLNAASPAASDHPYLKRKGVTPVESLRELAAEHVAEIIGYRPKAGGELLSGRVLLAPVEIDSALSTVEMIDEAGRKSALAGGAKRGGFWLATPLPEGDDASRYVLIAEGVATALSAHEATGAPTVAALSVGQLESAARSIRRRLPNARIAILADVTKDTGEPEPRAVEAARAVGAILAVPDFGPSRSTEMTDFNDMAAVRGVEAVRVTIRAAIDAADGSPGEHEGDASESDVTNVTDVTASNHEDLGATPPVTADVTDVTDTPIPGAEERPRFVVLDEPCEERGARFRPGVWYFGVKAGKDPSALPPFVCRVFLA